MMHEYLISLHSAYEAGDTVLQWFERGNAFERRNGIMFDFYLELPHILSTVYVGGTEMHC